MLNHCGRPRTLRRGIFRSCGLHGIPWWRSGVSVRARPLAFPRRVCRIAVAGASACAQSKMANG
eukprot:14613255-Alexandrium_andersonii.AAC.1